MGLPRVILLEDDASLQRLAVLALDDDGMELQLCSRLAHAREALRQAPCALLITDLLLPDGSALDLLQDLTPACAPWPVPRCVVLSGGLDEHTRAALNTLGVWRQLSKPCSMAQLQACVHEALATWDAAPTKPTEAAESPTALRTPDIGPPTPAAPASTTATALSAEQTEALHRNFGGMQSLYLAFHASCLQQFAHDLREGDIACEQEDTAALRRLAHNLKSVLMNLGHLELSAQARQLEDAAAQAPQLGPALRADWQRLRQGVAALR